MHGRRALARLGTAATQFVLVGCAALVPTPGERLGGRMSVQISAHADQPVRGLSAGFELLGNADAGELRLSNPLGLQVAAARWRPGDARLLTADGESRFSDLDALAREALGEPVPLAALPDWLRGRPWPGAASAPNGTGFEQLGWAVDLSRRAEGFVIARRAAPPAVTLRVRIEAAP